MRSALFASATSLLSYASPALAQIPAFSQPEPATEPSAPLAPVIPAPPAPPPVSPELPPAPAPPAGAATRPASPNAPAPAKADHITAPDAHRAAEANVEADERYDADEAGQRSEWYGWQTLVADGPSLTAFFAGVVMSDNGNREGDRLAWLGILGYEFAPGIVHFAHRNPGRAFASFGMRLGLPLAGAFIGASLASGCNASLCEASGAGAGILLGMGGAIALDAAVLAYDDPKPADARGRLLVPLASVTPHQAWIGIGGEL